jgi:hypothetical protein
VLALQILADKELTENIRKDAGQDQKIGLSELIYILQKIISPSLCSLNSVRK